MPPDSRGPMSISPDAMGQLADQSGDGLLAFDRELNCLYGNLAIRRLTGQRPNLWVGKPAGQAFPFIDVAALTNALGGVRSAVHHGTLGTASERRHFEAQYFPLQAGNGEVVAAGALVRDVTARRQNEQALGEMENRFRNMADASPVLLWMSGTDGLCTFFNQSWLRFTGRTMAEEWGVGWAENIHFEDFEGCMNTYVRAFGERAVFEMEYRLRRADGEYRWILDRGSPRYTPEGAFAGYIGSCIDITERRRLEADLRGAVRVRDEFLSVASHELGTPLTSVRLLVDTLLRSIRKQPDQGTELMETRLGAIGEQLIRLSNLVDTLLDVSHIAEGRLILSPEPVELASLVRRVIGRMNQVATDAGCAVSLSAPQPVHGMWDRVRTEQVVGNLLSNAFKYGAGKPVEVAVAADDGAARVRVCDQGIGIPPDKQAVIFERFERAAPKNQYGGFGLGLWIARRALDEMGGAIRVRSQEGVGAEFEVELPFGSGGLNVNRLASDELAKASS
jgi:PAS domain S-box-containing protein